ncbi:MAG: transposase [Deferribacteraceae bacterium]|jgi:hypothetical protein|nr:transposase [Deferribacteraceae bacterium]
MVSVAKLLREMPLGYEQACFNTQAIQRKRGITDPNSLMLLSLIHLIHGCSLLEISTIGKLSGLADISDVAFMKRFESCNDWFKWIISKLLAEGCTSYAKPTWLEPYRVLCIDASDVCEKGRSGRLYRLHYAIDLFKMESVQYTITEQSVGESLFNYKVSPKDLIIGDRAYGYIKGMRYCLDNQGNFILRLRNKAFKLYDAQGNSINLLEHLRKLDVTEYLDLAVFVSDGNGEKISLRICAKRKSREDNATTQKRLNRQDVRKQKPLSPETREINEYIILATALPQTVLAGQVVELYRIRWQIENYFKRLKSIMDFGELPKRRPKSAMAWLNGKLMVALLMEIILAKAVFSPAE